MTKALWILLLCVLVGGFSWTAGGPARAENGVPTVQPPTYQVADGEVLHDVARRFGLGFVELRAANPGVNPWVPGDGTVLNLPTTHLLPDAPREGIVINLADLRLYYFPKSGDRPQSFPIGIGRSGWLTPAGVARVVGKRTNPTWTVPDSIRAESPWLPRHVPPGPNNPLGAHAINLSMPGYLLHGTNRPDGVGRRVSHGCIRLYPEHIAELFEKVPVGTSVRIVDQPVKTAWQDGELFVEAHPTQEEADLIEQGEWPTAPPAHLGDAIARVRHAAGARAYRLDLERVVEVVSARRGVPEQVTRRETAEALERN